VALAAGTRIGQYEVISPLGAGGMGEVYRARDTKLNRDVALKALPESFALDPGRLQRFEREARTLAALNHPGIAQIFGTVEVEGHEALVMELVPGPTLDELIASAARTGAGLPIPDVVRIASQLAEALEAAHEAGIVHRDLKPANIKVRDDDVVKILDFGLARVSDPAADSLASPSMATMLSPAMTQHGVILGTAGYMSPEQARGRPADKRSDIWAFGVVVWEMLTGRRLFKGETVSELIAAVIKDAPDLSALPASTPPAFRRLLERCLERDPKQRLRDIGEARIALATALNTSSPPATAAVTSARRANRALWAAGALALAAVGSFAAWQLKPAGPSVPVRRYELPAVVGQAAMGLSPDGTRVAYAAEGHLYVHDLRTAATVELGAVPPNVAVVFWSHDSRTVGFSVESSLRTIPASGGVAFTVCKVPASGRVLAALWRDDGTILFAVWRDSVYQVASAGGAPSVWLATDAKTEVDFHSIAALPGNRVIVTTHLRGQDTVRTDLVAGGQRTTLTTDPLVDAVQFHPPDLLLFRRRQTNAGVWAVRFDGGPIDFAKSVLVEAGASSFDAAKDGTIVAHLPARVRKELVWISRTGTITPLPGQPFELAMPRLSVSPDGRRLVLCVRGPQGEDVFVVRDLTTGADTRLPPPVPAVAGMRTGGHVTWRSLSRLLYAAGGIERLAIFDWPADGSAGGRELAVGMLAKPARHGQELVIAREVGVRSRLFRAPVQPDGSVAAGTPLFPETDDPDVRQFDLTDESRLLAYTSRDPTTTRQDLFVATYPDLVERRQVTIEGGTSPRFSRDGQSLFYLSGRRGPGGALRGQLNAIAVTASPLALGAPTVLLIEGEDPAATGQPDMNAYDLGPDGRFLMARRLPPSPEDRPRTMILQNWTASLQK
jgi:hypothetical protein